MLRSTGQKAITLFGLVINIGLVLHVQQWRNGSHTTGDKNIVGSGEIVGTDKNHEQ